MEFLTESEKEYILEVAKHGQERVIASLDTKEKLQNFISDLQYVDSSYPGGYKQYLDKIKQLLHDSSMKINPLQGWVPSVPRTIDVDFNTKEYHELEAEGLKVLQESGFVLVAGGLGERLGYNNIKVSLPVETFTMCSYLEYYISKILAIQHRIPKEKAHLIPFAIMTSDNNHELTMQFLESHNYFGMSRDQLFIMKQDVVPSVVNLECELAISQDGHLIRKPHGHGDVHLCLYRDGIVDKWIKEFSVRRLFFFQDTNALSFYTMACSAAIAEREHAHMLSTCVRRRPHEASGALCQLKHEDGREFICNVEYNQLEDFLKTIDPRGDFPDEAGYSPFPGNSNILSFNASLYAELLSKSHGIVPEFVNPKYKPNSRSEYQQPVRLESMMQDYPKLMLAYGAGAGDGAMNGSHVIVTYPRFVAWSPVKNSPSRGRELFAKTGHEETAKSGERDQLMVYRRVMESKNECGVCNGEGRKYVEIEEGGVVVLGKESGATTEEVHQHLGEGVVVKKGGVLIVKSREWYLRNVTIEGCCVLEGEKVVMENVVVRNRGWHYEAIEEDDPRYSVVFQIRGHVVVREEQCEIKCSKEIRDTVLEGVQCFTE